MHCACQVLVQPIFGGDKLLLRHKTCFASYTMHQLQDGLWKVLLLLSLSFVDCCHHIVVVALVIVTIIVCEFNNHDDYQDIGIIYDKNWTVVAWVFVLDQSLTV